MSVDAEARSWRSQPGGTLSSSLDGYAERIGRTLAWLKRPYADEELEECLLAQASEIDHRVLTDLGIELGDRSVPVVLSLWTALVAILVYFGCRIAYSCAGY